VDKAANRRSFLLIKRKDGGSDVDEFKEVLGNIEKALNDIGTRIEKVEKGIEEKDFSLTFDTSDVEKAGAKFSKQTITSLRGLRSQIDKILEGSDDSKEVSREDTIGAITKGIQSALVEKEEPKGTDLEETIKKVLTEALKSVKE